MQWIVPQTKRVRFYRRRVAEMLKPIISKRIEDMKRDTGLKKPSDMVQWLIDNSDGRGGDLAFQANEHIVMNVAAIHTTGGQLAHTLYDLARYPEYVPQLREEIGSVLSQDGSITKQGLFRLKKMDSFLREVQRLSPPSMVSTNRKVLKPLKLSNGVVIPAGTSLAASPACVSRDPAIWKDPDCFDGFRFYKLRETEGEEKYQFATVNEDALSFGQ
jgi:cytochrome P450